MIVDEFLYAELADLPVVELLSEMCDFMSIDGNKEAADQLIVRRCLIPYLNVVDFYCKIHSTHRRCGCFLIYPNNKMELMQDIKKKYGKSTLTLDVAPTDTYLQIANYRFDNETTENLLAAIEYFESPKSCKSHICSCVFFV